MMAKRIALFVVLKVAELIGLAVAYCALTHLGNWLTIVLSPVLKTEIVSPGWYHPMSLVFALICIGAAGFTVGIVFLWVGANWDYVKEKVRDDKRGL